jgi:translation initiation factor 3 subunit L
MADPTAFYEPEEEELLSSLAVPSYDDGYEQDQDYQRHLQELESHAFAQHGQGDRDQEAEQAAALEGVPQEVKKVCYPREARGVGRI